jgi:hypothetical protein
MNKLVAFVAFAAFFTAFVAADDVLDLGDADFDGTLEDVETALVMFYAPW